MTYRITLQSGFRSPFGQRRGLRLWHPGQYSVPKDMPEEVADQAMKSGFAHKELEPVVQEASASASDPVVVPQENATSEPEPVPGVEDPQMAAAGEAEFQQRQGGEIERVVLDSGDVSVLSTTQFAESNDDDDDEEDADKPAPRRRGRPRGSKNRKGPAPSNKSRGRAPRNKADADRDDQPDVG